MLRSISVAVISGAMLAAAALPATAETPATSRVQTFSIPGVHGISAWGSYYRIGPRVRVTVCVRDTARDVYGGAAAGVAFNSRYSRWQAVTAAVVGFPHSACRSIITADAGHLFVDAISGYRGGTVRQAGKVKQVY